MFGRVVEEVDETILVTIKVRKDRRLSKEVEIESEGLHWGMGKGTGMLQLIDYI